MRGRKEAEIDERFKQRFPDLWEQDQREVARQAALKASGTGLYVISWGEPDEYVILLRREFLKAPEKPLRHLLVEFRLMSRKFDRIAETEWYVLSETVENVERRAHLLGSPDFKMGAFWVARPLRVGDVPSRILSLLTGQAKKFRMSHEEEREIRQRWEPYWSASIAYPRYDPWDLATGSTAPSVNPKGMGGGPGTR